MERDPILAEILARRGGTNRLAAACGITHSAVSQWRRVPGKHTAAVLAVAREIGVSTGELERGALSSTSAEAA